jgi:hypothetical protein
MADPDYVRRIAAKAWRLGGCVGGNGWHFSQQIVAVTRDADAGEGGVPFDHDVSVITVTD